MKVAVIGTSPIMALAVRRLRAGGRHVEVFEESKNLGGAWASDYRDGLIHRFSNVVVAYSNADLEMLAYWKNFMLSNKAALYRIPERMININQPLIAAFLPEFNGLLADLQGMVNKKRVKQIAIHGDKVSLDGDIFDYVILPAYSSTSKVLINNELLHFRCIDTTSVHVTCLDEKSKLEYAYFEGASYIFDRYSKGENSNAFVGRLQRKFKSTSVIEIINALKSFTVLSIVPYTTHYRDDNLFEEFRRLRCLSRGKLRVLDTRQFVSGLRDLALIDDLV